MVSSHTTAASVVTGCASHPAPVTFEMPALTIAAPHYAANYESFTILQITEL
jgi:hypothetical protein